MCTRWPSTAASQTMNMRPRPGSWLAKAGSLLIVQLREDPLVRMLLCQSVVVSKRDVQRQNVLQLYSTWSGCLRVHR